MFCKHILPGVRVYWSNNWAFQFPSSHVLCIQVTSFPRLLLEQSSCLSQKKKLCRSQDSFASGSAPKRKYGQDHTSFGSLLFTWSSLAFSQQILHPQTTPHAFKPHARACKTPTQFLAINTSRKWAATQPSHYYTCTELRKKVNLFISRFKAQRML